MKSIDVIQRLYAGFASGDLPAILAGMSPEIEWTEAEGYPYAAAPSAGLRPSWTVSSSGWRRNGKATRPWWTASSPKATR